MKPIYFLSTFNTDWSQHVAVLYTSIIHNLNPQYKAFITLVTKSVTEQDKEILEIYLRKLGAEPRFINPVDHNYDKYEVDRHYTNATLYRFLMDEYYKTFTDKVIYIDSDIIVEDDISKIYETDLHGMVAGAVPEPTRDNYDRVGITNPRDYFNAGLLIVDINKYREEQIGKKALHQFLNNKKLQRSQDALNYALKGQWVKLPIKWNVVSDYFKRPEYYKENSDILEAVKNPSLIHYTESIKPWQYISDHPYKENYYFYLNKTPWSKYTPPDKNFYRVIRKQMRNFKLMIFN